MIPQTIISAVGYLIGAVALAGTIGRIVSIRSRRFGGLQRGGLVRLETIALDPRRRMHLVQCGERKVVLLVGGNQDVVVGWLQEQ